MCRVSSGQKALQATSNNQQTTNNKQQTTNNKQTNDKQQTNKQTTNDKQQTTNNKQQTYKQQTTNNKQNNITKKHINRKHSKHIKQHKFVKTLLSRLRYPSRSMDSAPDSVVPWKKVPTKPSSASLHMWLSEQLLHRRALQNIKQQTTTRKTEDY